MPDFMLFLSVLSVTICLNICLSKLPENPYLKKKNISHFPIFFICIYMYSKVIVSTEIKIQTNKQTRLISLRVKQPDLISMDKFDSFLDCN